MKAILVIDMPTECIECEFCRVFADDKPTETHCILTAQRNEDGINTIAKWCPLRPIPKKMRTDGDDIEEDSYWMGWNDCVDEITGETE
jgi:hypothetical protein